MIEPLVLSQAPRTLDVSVDRSSDTHFREQHWSAILGSIDQHLNCKPPTRQGDRLPVYY
jgi:hypothetical protein